MAEPVPFKGQTHDFGPPVGEEERCGRLPCLLNGSQVVSAWKFTREQLQEMIDNDSPMYVSIWSGSAVLPVYVGTKSEVNGILLDFGKQMIE